MRTTIDLPDLLARELRAEGARGGIFLKNMIGDAVEAEIRKPEGRSGKRIKFPVLPSGEPGALFAADGWTAWSMRR